MRRTREPAFTSVSPGVSCGFSCGEENPAVVLRDTFSPDTCRRGASTFVKWSVDHRKEASVFGKPLPAVDTPWVLLRYLHFPEAYAKTFPMSVNFGVVRPGGIQFRQALNVNRRFAPPFGIREGKKNELSRHRPLQIETELGQHRSASALGAQSTPELWQFIVFIFELSLFVMKNKTRIIFLSPDFEGFCRAFL